MTLWLKYFAQKKPLIQLPIRTIQRMLPVATLHLFGNCTLDLWNQAGHHAERRLRGGIP